MATPSVKVPPKHDGQEPLKYTRQSTEDCQNRQNSCGAMKDNAPVSTKQRAMTTCTTGKSAGSLQQLTSTKPRKEASMHACQNMPAHATKQQEARSLPQLVLHPPCARSTRGDPTANTYQTGRDPAARAGAPLWDGKRIVRREGQMRKCLCLPASLGEWIAPSCEDT